MRTTINRLQLATVIIALFGIQAVARSQTVVYPTGDAPQDVASVRAAVRHGGTVLLKATDTSGNPRVFNFGDFPVSEIDWNYFGSGYVALGTSGEIVAVPVDGFTLYVSLGNDVRLVGETVGAVMTTIQGGTVPVRNFEPRTVPGVGERFVFGLANLTIENIRFSESALQSIYTTQLGSFPEIRALVHARGLHLNIDIRRNQFVDVQPALDFFWYALAAVTDGPAGGVRAEGNLVHFTPGKWDADERNYEQQNGLPPASEFWEGISIADLHDAGDVLANRVQGTDIALLVYFEGSEFVHVADNVIELRPEGFIGIACQANHTYLIERNTVFASGVNPDGIVLWASDPLVGINDSTVRRNRIVLDGSDFAGISLIGGGARNSFTQNVIEGSGAFALGLVADFFAPDTVAQANAFAGNQISHFNPRESSVYGFATHVFFDAHSRANVFVGNSRSVVDFGQDNSVTGLRQPAQPAGPTLSAALAARRSLMSHVRP